MSLQEENDLFGKTSQAANLLEKARERRQNREDHLFLDVPTWGGDLIAEYRILDPSETKIMADQISAKLRNGGAEPGYNDITLIAAMCVGLHMLDREENKRVPITDEFGIVNYARIAKKLGKEEVLKSAHDTIKYLMSEKDPNNPDKYVVNLIAISLHASSIQRWMRDTSKHRVDLEELLGEL